MNQQSSKREPSVVEWCPGCGLEQSIPSDRPSLCPNCKNPLLPCSECKALCDWTEDHGCSVFPGNEEVKHEDKNV